MKMWPKGSRNPIKENKLERVSQERLDYEKSLHEIVILNTLLSYAKERSEIAKIAYEKIGY
jgi:hypothetical protein